MITKEQWIKYVQIQESGVINMFYVSKVIKLSNGLLERMDCIDIMKNYRFYKEEFK